MGRIQWLEWAVLGIGLAAGAAACDDGGGGGGGGGSGGGTGTLTATATVCPMESDACATCRTDKCSANCTSADCQMKLENLKSCVCSAQAAGESYGSCGGVFAAGDQDANLYEQCINDKCGKPEVCNF